MTYAAAANGMTFAKFFPSDWRTGCLVLNLEEEGLYVRVCMFHYDTGKALPDNDAQASRLLNVQIHKYKKVMKSLIDKGKIIRAQGILFNERVQEEIDKYRIQHAARSEAAKKREVDRKSYVQREIEKALAQRASTQQTTQPAHTQASPVGGVPSVPDDGFQPTQSRAEKDSKYKGSDTTAVVQAGQSSATNPESRSQKLEDNSGPPTNRDGLGGLNGSAEPMLQDIVKWMNCGDVKAAREWLANFLKQYGQDVVRDSYMDMKTRTVSGDAVAKPLQYWASAARRMKAEPQKPKVAAVKDKTLSAFDRAIERERRS